MAVLIGGQLITSVGGFVSFTAFTSTRSRPKAVALTSAAGSMDCSDWSLQKHSFLDDTTNSGSFGAQNMDIAAEGWAATINVITDIRNPADMLARYGVTTSATMTKFNLGTQIYLVEGSGINYPDDTVLNFWWSPSCKIQSATPVIDANSKKMVRMSIVVVGNSLIFKMPAEAGMADKYMDHLLTRSQTF